MKLSSIIIVSVAMLAASGCVSMTRYVSHPDIDPHRLEASASDYKVVETVEGRARATYIFGIGGLSSKAKRSNALTNMYDNARLERNQAIINIVTRQQDELILPPVYWGRTFITTGVIIEYITSDDAPQTDGYKPSTAAIMPDSKIRKMPQDQQRDLQNRLEMELFDDLDNLPGMDSAELCEYLPVVKEKIKIYESLCRRLPSSGYIDFTERLRDIEASFNGVK